MNTVELKDAIAQGVAEVRSIVETCKAEVRDLTEEERSKIDDIKRQIDENKTALRKLQEDLDKYVPTMDDIEERKEDKNTTHNKMEKRNFSILKAIRSVVENKPQDEFTRKVMELGAEEIRKNGVNVEGQIQIPTDIETRNTVTVTAEHDDVIETMFDSILTPLLPNSVLANVGARQYNNLVGDVQIPIISEANCTWEGETDEAQDGAPTFTSLKLAPKRLTCYCDISKQMLVQDSIGVENAVRQQIMEAINNKFEATVLGDGAGSATEPKGLFNGLTPATVTKFSEVVALESELERKNYRSNNFNYVASPEAKGKFRTMIFDENAHKYLVYNNGQLDGTPVQSTSHVAENKFLIGDWSNLAIAHWSGIDIVVDPYTQAKNAVVRLVINVFLDAKEIREGAFKAGVFA